MKSPTTTSLKLLCAAAMLLGLASCGNRNGRTVGIPQNEDPRPAAADDSPSQNAESGTAVADEPTANDAPPPANPALGMGLSGITSSSTQYPFIDLMKQARGWKDWDNKVEGFSKDERDWVTALKAGQTAGTVFLVVPKEMPAIYDRAIVFYEGEGEIEYGWRAKKIDSLSRPGRDVITLSQGNHLLKIVRTNPDNYIRNIRIIPERHLAAYERGEVFNPDWVARIENFPALRFMDWLATNNSRQQSWEQRPRIEDRTWAVKGVPLEMILQLANQVGADPWLNIPHLADGDYIERFAELVKANLNPDANVYVEHSNEVWNWQFQQARHANATGRERWGDRGNAYMQWHGMRTAQICDIFKQEVFTAASERVKCVLGVQTSWRGLQTAALECPLWVAEGNEPCFKHGFDYIGITSYFDGGLNGPRKAKADPEHVAILQSWFQEPDGGMTKAFEQLTDGRHLRAIEKFSDYQGVEQEIEDRLAYWQPTAASYGLGLVAYEGGQHITANGHVLQNDPAVAEFHTGVNRDPRMQGVYSSLLNAWEAGGGDLHAHFVDISFPSKWGSWGALEYVTQESSPKWNALLEFNRRLSQGNETPE